MARINKVILFVKAIAQKSPNTFNQRFVGQGSTTDQRQWNGGRYLNYDTVNGYNTKLPGIKEPDVVNNITS